LYVTAKSLVEIGSRPGKFPNKYDNPKSSRPKSAPSSSGSREKKEVPPASPPKAVVPSRTKSAGSGRTPRANVTAAYPFADSEFNAHEVITGTIDLEEDHAKGPSSPVSSGQPRVTPSFAILAPSVRRRLSARAFSDYAQGSATLRVSDIPAALAALGLHVGAGIPEALLAHARLSAAAAVAQGAPVADPKLRLFEWQDLVEKYVDQDKARKVAAHKEAVAQRVRMKIDSLAANAAAAHAVGGDTSEGQALVEALLSIEAIDGQSALDQADTVLNSAAGATMSETENQDDNENVDVAAEDAVYRALGRGIVEARNRLSKMSPEQKHAAGAGRYANRVKAAGTGAGVTGATRKRWDSTLSSALEPARNTASSKTTAASRIRSVPSKIGSQVRKDRASFKYNQRETDGSALRSVAKDKVEVLVSGKGRRQGSASTPENVDLTSGSSAMHIAQAFLSGPVGQQLGEMEGSYALQHQELIEKSGKADISEVEAEVQFLLSAPDVVRDYATLSEHELRVAAATEAAKQQQLLNYAERARRQGEEQNDEVDLPSEWVAHKGGYVADFGASQTGTAHFRR
jgi:hypothetical protein